MPLRLTGLGAAQPAFGCSPAREVLASLHVLADVRHHPLHISWVLRARERMSTGLRERVAGLTFWFSDRVPLPRRIWPGLDAREWPEELADLRAAPVEDFAEEFLHAALLAGGVGERVPLAVARGDADLRERALARVASRHPPSVPVLRELLDDPESARESFAALLDAYWRDCLEPDWPSMRARLRDDIARRGRAASRRGLARMLDELSPHIRADPAGDGVVIRLPRRGERAEELAIVLAPGDQVVLVPSYFVWPELTAVVQRDRSAGRERSTVTVGYALPELRRESQAPIPPERLLKLLRGAGDPTRLQILRLLARRPRSTREIAGLVGLTEAAISKQLKLLLDAGWVAAQRRGHYVYYELARDRLSELSTGLAELLG
jgi:DNA-binding transcriptional ArsR family regulator